MQAEQRLGKIEICGAEYPLNYCIRNASEISELIADKSSKSDFDTMCKNIKILRLLMRDGAAYMREVHGEPIGKLPEIEQLVYMLSPGDNPRVVAAVKDAIERGGMRLVEVAAKKDAATSAK